MSKRAVKISSLLGTLDETDLRVSGPCTLIQYLKVSIVKD